MYFIPKEEWAAYVPRLRSGLHAFEGLLKLPTEKGEAVMKVKKGALLNVRHNRSGNWKGIATADFDTETDEWFPIALAEEEVSGIHMIWKKGDDMPARRGLCTVSLVLP